MKKQILSSLILAGSLVAAVSAHAEDNNQSSNTSTVKITDVQKKDEQTNGDIDNEITNAKMRAESGSKSVWSMQMSLDYSGGNLETPFGAVRPNYSGAAGVGNDTSIGGTIGVNYRLDKNSALSFGTGISVHTPFQNTFKDSTNQENERKFSISTPSVSYSRSFRSGSVQNAFSAGLSYSTDVYDVDTLKSLGSASLSHTFLWDIAGSNWQPGINFAIDAYAYTDGADQVDTVTGRGGNAHGGGRLDYDAAAFPFVEYAFNDKYSFRTVFRPFTFNHFRSDSDSTWYRSLYTQSVGLGIAVTRDIYMYPNMQFAPEHLVADRTNVGLSTTINLF